MMLRTSRTATYRLRLSFSLRNNEYSTAPVPSKALNELEKADQAKDLELRTMQAPNRTRIWATSQRPRKEAFDQPRFERAILQMQVIFP